MLELEAKIYWEEKAQGLSIAQLKELYIIYNIVARTC